MQCYSPFDFYNAFQHQPQRSSGFFQAPFFPTTKQNYEPEYQFECEPSECFIKNSNKRQPKSKVDLQQDAVNLKRQHQRTRSNNGKKYQKTNTISEQELLEQRNASRLHFQNQQKKPSNIKKSMNTHIVLKNNDNHSDRSESVIIHSPEPVKESPKNLVTPNPNGVNKGNTAFKPTSKPFPSPTKQNTKKAINSRRPHHRKQEQFGNELVLPFEVLLEHLSSAFEDDSTSVEDTDIEMEDVTQKLDKPVSSPPKHQKGKKHSKSKKTFSSVAKNVEKLFPEIEDVAMPDIEAESLDSTPKPSAEQIKKQEIQYSETISSIETESRSHVSTFDRINSSFSQHSSATPVPQSTLQSWTQVLAKSQIAFEQFYKQLDLIDPSKLSETDRNRKRALTKKMVAYADKTEGLIEQLKSFYANQQTDSDNSKTTEPTKDTKSDNEQQTKTETISKTSPEKPQKNVRRKVSIETVEDESFSE